MDEDGIFDCFCFSLSICSGVSLDRYDDDEDAADELGIDDFAG